MDERNDEEDAADPGTAAAARRLQRATLVAVLLVGSGLGVALPDAAPGYAHATYWSTALLVVGGLLLALQVHGWAQRVAARRAGLPAGRQELWPFGTVRLDRGGAPPGTGAAARLAGAGVAALGALALAAWLLSRGLHALGGSDLVVVATGWLARLVGVAAVVHVLPAPPLAGGVVLRAVLARSPAAGPPGAQAATATTATTATSAAGRLTCGLLAATGAIAFLAGARGEGLALVAVAWILLQGVRLDAAQPPPVTVGDVMTRDPVVAPGWLTVEAFLDRYREPPPFAAFPVQRFSGELDGLVDWARLRDVPAERRATTRVSDVARPLHRLCTATPDEEVARLLERLEGSDQPRSVVVDRGRVVGIVAPSDLRSVGSGQIRARPR
jgi:CBS domain-containing protein